MLFPSLEFFLFFVILFVLYWYVFTRSRDRKILLLVANFVFYGVYSFGFAVLVFVLCLLNWSFALVLRKMKNYKPRKLIFIGATAFNILYLLYFKEAYHLFDWLKSINVGILSEDTYLRLLSITAITPLGVSYYVFKSCSYLFDVYLGKMQARRSPVDVLVYVSFFPQIFSGPIVNASVFFNDFENALNRDKDRYAFLEFDRASLFIMLGLVKKLLVANTLMLLVTKPVFANPANYHSLELIFAAIAYSVVIYADFSGYSDMAIGIALLLGFHTPANFDRPYTAKSITEFWRRWHISFSTWLRDYVYFSFGGSRFGRIRTVMALIGTMLIGGLWHGFKYTFLIWGALHGIALAVERLLFAKKTAKPNMFEPLRNEENPPSEIFVEAEKNKPGGTSENNAESVPPEPDETSSAVSPDTNKQFGKKIGSQVFCFCFVTISWIFFRAESLSEVTLFFRSLKNIFTPMSVFNPFCLLLVVFAIALQFVPKAFTEKAFAVYGKFPLPLKALFLAAVFVLLGLFVSSGIPEFIYFKF